MHYWLLTILLLLHPAQGSADPPITATIHSEAATGAAGTDLELELIVTNRSERPYFIPNYARQGITFDYNVDGPDGFPVWQQIKRIHARLVYPWEDDRFEELAPGKSVRFPFVVSTDSFTMEGLYKISASLFSPQVGAANLEIWEGSARATIELFVEVEESRRRTIDRSAGYWDDCPRVGTLLPLESDECLAAAIPACPNSIWADVAIDGIDFSRADGAATMAVAVGCWLSRTGRVTSNHEPCFVTSTIRYRWWDQESVTFSVFYKHRGTTGESMRHYTEGVDVRFYAKPELIWGAETIAEAVRERGVRLR